MKKIKGQGSIKFKPKLNGIQILLLLMGVQFLSLQNGNACLGGREEIFGGSGGHDVPTPFQITKTKFELADGEFYTLVGTVVLAPSYKTDQDQLRPYFSINLENHPWLANAKRIISPLYFIEGSMAQWKKWEGTPIILLCRARGRIISTAKGPEYSIHLVPISIEHFSTLCPAYPELFSSTDY